VASDQVAHPNREKVASKATRGAIVLLLAITAALVAFITIGGWSVLQGARIVSLGYVVLCVVMAFYVARWNRGVLPVMAAFAILFAVMAGVAGPAWFARDQAGFDSPAVDAGLLGLSTFVLIAAQVLLLLFAVRGFAQKWNVEVEPRRGRPAGLDGGGSGDPQPPGI